jgi:hypothetical protein
MAGRERARGEWRTRAALVLAVLLAGSSAWTWQGEVRAVVRRPGQLLAGLYYRHVAHFYHR